MTRTKNYDAKVIGITGGNLRNNHIYLRSALDLIPKDAIGGTRSDDPGVPIEVSFVPGSSVQTDLPSDKLFLRCRAEVGEFFAQAGVKEGNFIVLTKLANRHFEIRKLT
jgi:hypothetical protein